MKYLYRIVNVLLAAAIFPVVVFADFLRFRLGTSLIDTVGLEEGLSIKFLIDVYRGENQGTFWHELLINNDTPVELSWPSALDPIKSKLIAFAVFFVIALVAALFIIVWSCFSNKRIPVLAATATGLISTIVMIACFNSAVVPLVDGTITIASILGGSGLLSILGNFVAFDGIILGGFHMGMIFLFVGLLVWTGSYYLIEIGDTPEEKAAAQAGRKK